MDSSRSFKKYLLVVLMAAQLRETILSTVRGSDLKRTSSSYSETRMFNVEIRSQNIKDQIEVSSFNLRMYPGPHERPTTTDDNELQEHFPFEQCAPTCAERRYVSRMTRLRRRESNTEFDQSAVPKLSRFVEMN